MTERKEIKYRIKRLAKKFCRRNDVDRRFGSSKEYADKMNYAKAIIKDLLDNSDEYARQRAIDFLEVKENDRK